ncbi:acyl--CoA ligase [Geomonas paludis]|uniref:AMP-dependent synthetase and ligase n=1 Tax=Geomonas paludis TaxID=2740185 RepID=A0A6V8MXL0_9BACT|nr:class I adenylate-forming enzyme family protein [Geomonas paludis]UPU37053.1 acyl--CoA ligase [Geomonas paludis]GFO64851.1 AMP-dependent synthetase and ligase [Geomonas paludis]
MELQMVHSFLESSAAARPDKVALVHDGERVSYRQLNRSASRLAGFLLQRGVLPGDRIVILLSNGVKYAASYYGVLKAGAVAVPLNVETGQETLGRLLDELQPAGIIVEQGGGHLLQQFHLVPPSVRFLVAIDTSVPGDEPRLVWGWDEALMAEELPEGAGKVSPEALASIIYTSGSTGQPKGVMLSHRNIVSNTRSITQYLRLTENDIQMVVLPFFYVMGKSLLNTHIAVGGTVVINNNFAYTASVIRQMAEEGVTGFSGVPSTYAYLLHRSPLASFRDRLPSLRYCTQAGGHMPREIKERLLQVLPPHTKLFIMYGATEAAARLTYVEPERLPEKLGSIGRAIPGVTVRVLDAQGEELPDGACGELVASGPNIMVGYWNDPEATARVLDGNGYHTGDLGYRDADGYLYVTGRKDHLLKVGGHRIDPQEIEEVLMSSGTLLEVVVLGLDDPLLGKKLVALAVPLGGNPSDRTLLSFCHARLPRHKIPGEIRLVAALPKYPSGKIDRASCLALCG